MVALASRHGKARTGCGASETASFDPNTGLVQQILAGTSNGIANFHYTWDSTGNLLSRADTYQGYTEYFCYDQLNRLQNYAVGASCTASGYKATAYDALGDITSKTGVGTYAYGAGAAGPHAVTSITGTVNGVTNPTFTYDANGNMTGSAGRSVTYTAFNMAAQITQGTTTVAFSYDSAHGRIKQVIGGGSPSTTYYLNALGAHSEKFVAGATTTWHDYIYAAGQLVAEHFNTGGTITMRYAVSDHLGSVSSVADASAAVTERLSYDAWGRRRNANGADNTACSITSAISRGYTGHEMMDAVCLINANARIYDPTLGRFMSADSIVPNAFDGQSFNRYAYVLNNPLAFIDPSGHSSGCSGSSATATSTGTRLPNVDSSCYNAVHGGDWLGFESGGGGAAGGGGCYCHVTSWNAGGSPETVIVQASWVSSFASLNNLATSSLYNNGAKGEPGLGRGPVRGGTNGVNSTPDGYYQDPDGVWRLHVTVRNSAGSTNSGYSASLGDLSLGGTYMIAPGVAISGSCGADGCYAIGGLGEGYSAKANIDLLGGQSLYHTQSAGYKGGLGLGASATIGLPIPAAIDTLLGTSIFQAAHSINGPVGIDVTGFVNFSGGHLNGSLDINLVPAVGQSAVGGIGYDGRHN